MSEQKPKKTFLKKGTRQFLSNATVRSLSQKPKIVQFSEDNLQSHISPSAANSKNSHKNQQKQQILINVKSKNIPKSKSQNPSNLKQNIRTNKIIQKKSQQKSQQKKNENYDKPIQSTHSASKSAQKKPTLLTDYLKNDQKPINKVSQKNISPAPIPKPSIAKQTPLSIIRSQVQNLKMQNIEDDSDEEQFDQQVIQEQENQFTKTFTPQNTKQNISPLEVKKNDNLKKKPNLLQEAFGKKQKQNINFQVQKADQNQVNFQSDSDDQKQKKSKFKAKANKAVHSNRFKQEKQEEQNENNQDPSDEQLSHKTNSKLPSKPQSKVTQMFNKNSKTTPQSSSEPLVSESSKSKKIGIDDVPKELIQQIVEKYFKEAKAKYQKKQQNLFDQVKIVEKKQQSLGQQEKAFQKRVKQFQKQMQQKNKQFQNKLKAQQSKITREKMYLKDHQTGNKVDWKTKNQIQQLKQQLQEERNQKKRIQVKLRGQLDRLKARYTQDTQIKKNLQMRIKEYQLKEIKEKQSKVKEEKQTKQQNLQRKKNFWNDAPKHSYLQRFFNNDFTLTQFFMEDYFYEQNQFYKYYSRAGQADTLQTEEVQGNKIKRTYENGKIEIESVQKFVKEVFPWGYTIVHYINGDVKQVIQLPNKNDPNSPNKIEVYFAKNNQIIQYSISEGKRIHYFLGQDQIELNDENIQLKEIYNGKQLQRMYQGSSEMLQKNGKGNFVQIY